MTSRLNLLFFLFFSWVSVLLQSYCTVVSGLETNRSCYCVTEDDSEDFNSDLCSECSSHNLSYFADTGAFNSSYSMFYFSLGHHSLFRGVTVSQYATNVTDLTLIGLTNTSIIDLCGNGRTPAAVVQCEGNTGFLFANVINLTIAGLEFRNCGFIVNVSSYKHSAAIALVSVWNLTMCNVQILFSNGWGLLGESVSGTSSINYSVFDGSHSVVSHSDWYSYGGGNLALFYDNNACVNSSFTISHTRVTNGCNYATTFNHAYGGGLHIYIKTTNAIKIFIDTVYFSGNVGEHGGNVAVNYATTNGAWSSIVTFSNCHFLYGLAKLGGGIFIVLSGDLKNTSNSSSEYTATIISIRESVIAKNTANEVGAGVYIQLHEDTELSLATAVEFNECVFDNNSNSDETLSRGGAAINLLNFRVPGYATHQSPQFKIFLISCNFTRNWEKAPLEDSAGSGTLFVEENAFMSLKDCLFEDNNCTGIKAVHSNIMLEGNIVLRNNVGYNGGGLVMCANSIIFLNLSKEVKVTIENCHAHNFGGGIYAEFECSQASPPCFFQTSNSTNIPEPHIYLHNNTASKAGTALYGGAVDYCYAFGPYNKKNKTRFFNKLFHIVPASVNNLSNITSNPINVCFCRDKIPACNEFSRISEKKVYPGGLLSVSLVVVGQRNGTVPGQVVATSLNEDDVQIEDHSDTEIKSAICTTIKYPIVIHNSEDLPKDVQFSFRIGDTAFKNAVIHAANIPVLNVTIASCPYGFSVSSKSGKCDCNHWVHSLRAICSITTNSIYRSRNSLWWIGHLKNTSNTATYSTFCPFDYCVREDIHIHVNESGFADSQCANNRRGILCGGCKGNRSNVLGSSSCKHCHSPHSILKMLGLILLFALLGIAFVFLVGILDMTVSEGTLNAIVFYMNVVSVNTNIFFDGTSTVNRVLEVFVAWMNLDLGIETCFYDGMGAIGKTILQFVFPLYLCLMSGLIIVFSRRSSMVTKMFGKNVVKILATMIFHLYAKVLRTVIDILRRSVVIEISQAEHGDVSSKVIYVWSVDGTTLYMKNEWHTILFVIAVAVIAVTLPYTLALLFIQCLRRRSNMKVLFWVNKLKPFFDAYTGPYKDNYHFWTGFLLLVRIALFIIIAVDTHSGQLQNITLIIATTSVLFVITRPGIYKNWTLNIIEVFIYANLTVLAVGTAYTARFNYSKNSIIVVCVGSVFLLFCGIVVYHILKKLSVTRRWGLMKVWLLDRRWPWMKKKQIRSLILPYVDPDNDEDLSSSDSELDPILQNAPPVARYDQYREPLIGTAKTE